MAPTSDSDVKMESGCLPVEQEVQGVGNGGWAGSIVVALLPGDSAWSAAAADTGHSGSASFALGHPEKLVDFAYRAIHEMAVQGKATTAAFYGSAPRYSYFTGCSNGGRQGFKEAQRYPDDFNGIASGAPAYNWTAQMAASIVIAQSTLADAASQIPAEKLKVLNGAVINACDAADGVKDGVLEAPAQCKFDPKVVECKSRGWALVPDPAQ